MPSVRSRVSAVAANAAGISAAAPKRWEGVDPAMERMVLRTCLDEAPERRDVREAFKDMQLSIDHCLFKPTGSIQLLCFSLKEMQVGASGEEVTI